MSTSTALVAALTVALTAFASSTASAEGLDGATRNFVLPTGELTPPGEVEWSQQQLFMAYTVGIGVTDGLEVDLIVPGLPFGGQAQLRVGLLPKSSDVRLVVGGGVVLFAGVGVITTASGTVAFHTEDLNMHASVMAYNGQSFDGRLGVLSAGTTWRFADKVALIADVTRFSVPDTECYTGPVTSHCEAVLDTATTYTVGVKILGKKLSADIGLMFVDALDYAPLPVVTFHH